jgi:hypothetical protein
MTVKLVFPEVVKEQVRSKFTDKKVGSGIVDFVDMKYNEEDEETAKKKNNKNGSGNKSGSGSGSSSHEDEDTQLKKEIRKTLSDKTNCAIDTEKDEIDEIIDKMKNMGIVESNGEELQKIRDKKKNSKLLEE